SSAQPSDAGQYQVVVSNSAGRVTSNTVSLTVNSVVTSSASFVKDDAGTQGSCASAYGADGYDISQYGASLPSYASVNLLTDANYTWNGNTTDVRALQEPGTGTGLAACWYSGSNFTIDVNITDGQ